MPLLELIFYLNLSCSNSTSTSLKQKGSIIALNEKMPQPRIKF